MDTRPIVSHSFVLDRWIERMRMGIVTASALALIFAGSNLPF